MAPTTPRRRVALWHGVLTALVLFGIIAGGPLVSLIGTAGTASATGGPDHRFKTVGLADGARVVPRWNPCQRAITYKVNLTGLPAGRRPAVLAEVRSAVGDLGAATGMRYRYAGATSFVPRTANLPDAPAELVVAAVDADDTDLDMAESSIGFGGVLWASWPSGAGVLRGYVVLNPAGFLALTPGSGPGTTQVNAILHELGHAAGLEHVRAGGELMDAELTRRAPDGYGPGDRAGLAEVGRAAGCLRIPADVGVADLS